MTSARSTLTTAPSANPRADFVRGVKLGFPIFLGYAPVGLAFGILAVQKGFTVLEAVICSATAIAGAGQFIAAAMLGAGAGAAAIVLATSIVNLRYVLFATTVSPYMRHVPIRWQVWLGFTLTDESFAVNIADLKEGKANRYSMAGVGVIAWLGWVGGTVIGALASTAIGNPSAWGVDFAMPAMFAALFVALADSRRQVGVGLFSAVVVIALALLGRAGITVDPSWFVIIASLATATLATVVFRDEGSQGAPVEAGSPEMESAACHDELLVSGTGAEPEGCGGER